MLRSRRALLALAPAGVGLSRAHGLAETASVQRDRSQDCRALETEIQKAFEDLPERKSFKIWAPRSGRAPEFTAELHGNERLFSASTHMQPGSIRVHRGENVKLGQVIGLVGNSGNSIAPHLHFQVTAGPSSLTSDGLPYEIDKFQVIGKSLGTEAFDKAEADGTRLEFTPVEPARVVRNALPLDQLISLTNAKRFSILYSDNSCSPQPNCPRIPSVPRSGAGDSDLALLDISLTAGANTDT